MTLIGGRFRLGVNFWARNAGPRMWSRYDDEAIVAELAQARSIGIDLLRIFAFVPDFVDGAPGRYTIVPAMLEHMKAFAAQAHAAGLALLPSPLVGHMSGENFDLPGTGDRSLFTDPDLLDGAAALVDAIARALAESPAVIGYALSNEIPLWAGAHLGRAMPAAAIASWLDRMIAACRAHTTVPIGLGDGVMNGFPNDEVAARVDFIAPHVYHADADPLRHGYRFDHAIELASRADKPVLLEEFGGSSAQAGDAEQAALWSEAIFAAFSLGARGAIGWCWSDFPVESVGRERPYDHHAFELGFGTTRADGSEKPVCDTLRAWRSFLDELEDAPPIRESRAGLVRSSHLDRDYPFSWQARGLCERTELTAYTLASQAGLAPRVIDEPNVRDVRDANLILIPSTQRLLTSTWLELEAQARSGATVYWSYFGGDHAFHQGAWCPIFERFTGVRHRLRYGCFDLPADELVLDGVLATIPPLPTGAAEVRRGASEAAPAAAFMPIEPIAAAVLSRDQGGRAILVEHRIGKGRVVFCAAPLERYAARLIDGTTRSLAHLYRWLDGRTGELDQQLCVRELTVGKRALTAIMNRSHDGVRKPAWAASLNTPLLSHAPLGGNTSTHLGPKQVVVIDRRSVDSREAPR